MSSLTFPLTFGLTKADKLTFSLTGVIVLAGGILLPNGTSSTPVTTPRQAQVPGGTYDNISQNIQAQVPGGTYMNEVV